MNEKGGRSRPFPLAEADRQTPGNFLACVRRDVQVQPNRLMPSGKSTGLCLHAHIGCACTRTLAVADAPRSSTESIG
jgi:hypothetical protein